MKGKRARLEALEARRQAWEAAHVPLSDVPGFLLAVLQIVEDEAGTETAGRVAGRMVGEKARRVARLAGGAA